MVGGELAISWVTVLRVEVGTIPIRANSLCASIVRAGNCKMSARVVFEMEAEGCVNQIAENKRERMVPRGGGERENVRRVLDPDRNPRTLVVLFMRKQSINFQGWHILEEFLVVGK